MNKFLLFACLLLTIASQSYAQKTIQGHKWETVDITFTAKGHIEKPFQVDLSATFKAPDGSQITVPGFYNDHNAWVVRFNPNQEGTWTSVSNSSLKKLNGIKHRIEVSPAKAGIHGGIKVSDTDAQKLIYEDGSLSQNHQFML